MPDPRHTLGVAAEALAARWLTDVGWRVLARRWRVPEGEIDLVALAPDGVLVGVEVRLRRSRRTGHPALTVDGRRVQRLRAALARYASDPGAPRHRGLRVDLITVEPVVPGAGSGTAWRLTRVPALDAW